MTILKHSSAVAAVRRIARSRLLPALTVTAVAVFLCVLMQRLYVTPIVTADTAGYLSAAMSQHDWGGYYRPPAYGFLMRLSMLSGSLLPLVYVQAGIWCLLVFFIAFVTGEFLRRPWIGAGIAGAFVWYDVQEMSLLPFHWHLLTDSLCVSSMLLACLGCSWAYVRQSSRYLVLSCVLVGFATWMRPVPAPLVLSCVALPLLIRACRPHASAIVMSVLFLGAPLVSESVINAVTADSWSPSPIAGLNLISHAEALYEEGDRVFSNDIWNEQFALMMRSGTWPKDDLVGFPVEHSRWAAMRAFYDDYTDKIGAGPRIFSIARLSGLVAMRLISFHPLKYLKNVTEQSWNIYAVSIADDQQWREGFGGIVRRRQSLLAAVPDWHLALFHGALDRDISDMAVRPFEIISSVRILPGFLLESPHYQLAMLFLALTTFAYGIQLCSAADRRDRGIGILLILLLGHAFLLAVLTAAIVYIDGDTRYRAPVLAAFTLSIVIGLTRLCIGRHSVNSSDPALAV